VERHFVPRRWPGSRGGHFYAGQRHDEPAGNGATEVNTLHPVLAPTAVEIDGKTQWLIRDGFKNLSGRAHSGKTGV
jgi:hypothetical protein